MYKIIQDTHTLYAMCGVCTVFINIYTSHKNSSEKLVTKNYALALILYTLSLKNSKFISENIKSIF